MKLWIMIGWLLTIAVAVAGIVGKEPWRGWPAETGKMVRVISCVAIIRRTTSSQHAASTCAGSSREKPML